MLKGPMMRTKLIFALPGAVCHDSGACLCQERLPTARLDRYTSGSAMGHPDSEHGGGGAFPSTRWTQVRGVQDPSSNQFCEALGKLASTYWRPVYGHFRRKWGRSHDEAKDMTQDFFCALTEKGLLSHLSPEQGRFRSYVMAALDNFARMDHRQRSALKRGGGRLRLSLEIGDGFEPSIEDQPEQAFVLEWVGAILDSALGQLEQEYNERGMQVAYRLFEMREMNPSDEPDVSYRSLAERFELSQSDVTNYLHRARKRLRELVMERVRDTVSTAEEAEVEMRELFGDLAR